MAVTLRDISDKSGFALSTVTEIMGKNGHRYSSETQKRVQEVASELGYRPNASARAMKTGRFGAIALLQGATARYSVLMQPTLRGIQAALAEKRMALVSGMLTDEELVREKRLPQILTEWMADGLLINYNTGVPERMTNLIINCRLPSIWLNTKRSADCVRPDDFGAGKMLTNHFLECGHTRIAFANYWMGTDATREVRHYSETERFEGYASAMQKAGLSPRGLWGKRRLCEAETVEYSRAWMSEPDRPTAVLSYHPHTLRPILHTALMMGLRVPEDLSLAIFHDAPFGELGYRLPVALLPAEEMGVKGVEALLSKIRQPEKALPPVLLPFGFEPGEDDRVHESRKERA